MQPSATPEYRAHVLAPLRSPSNDMSRLSCMSSCLARSHNWKHGQSAMRIIKKVFQEMLPGLEVFLGEPGEGGGGLLSPIVMCTPIELSRHHPSCRC